MQKIWIFILIGIVIVLVGISAFLYGQNQGVERNGAATTENANIDSENVLTENLSLSPTITKENEAPVVVFEAEGAFPSGVVSQIRSKVVEPFIDFKKDNQPGELVSVQVSLNPHPSKNEFPYLLNAIYKNGGNEGFVIRQTNGVIDWYIPECLNGCQFSEEFSTKYPEIVELTN